MKKGTREEKLTNKKRGTISFNYDLPEASRLKSTCSEFGKYLNMGKNKDHW